MQVWHHLLQTFPPQPSPNTYYLSVSLTTERLICFALGLIAHVSSVRILTVGVNVLQQFSKSWIKREWKVIGVFSWTFVSINAPRSNLKKDSFSSPVWKEVLVVYVQYLNLSSMTSMSEFVCSLQIAFFLREWQHDWHNRNGLTTAFVLNLKNI